METIPTPLIKKALNITGKSMEDMEDIQELYYTGFDSQRVDFGFSIEKFFTYLLSPSFIEKYALLWLEGNPGVLSLKEDFGWDDKEMYYNRSEIIGRAIYEYQKGNSEPLIQLLSKI